MNRAPKYIKMLVAWLFVGLCIHLYFGLAAESKAAVEQKREVYLRQFENNDDVSAQIRTQHWLDNNTMILSYSVWGVVGIGLVLVITYREIAEYELRKWLEDVRVNGLR